MQGVRRAQAFRPVTDEQRSNAPGIVPLATAPVMLGALKMVIASCDEDATPRSSDGRGRTIRGEAVGGA